MVFGGWIRVWVVEVFDAGEDCRTGVDMLGWRAEEVVLGRRAAGSGGKWWSGYWFGDWWSVGWSADVVAAGWLIGWLPTELFNGWFAVG